MVTFHTEAQRRVYDKVAGYMRELFGEGAKASQANPTFWVPHGSTAALVSVLPWGTEDATVTIRAYVVFESELSAELMDFLLHENDQSVFGAFGLDEDDDVFFEHAILGSACDAQALKTYVVAVMNVADEYDDKIQAQWGGERTVDHLAEKFEEGPAT